MRGQGHRRWQMQAATRDARRARRGETKRRARAGERAPPTRLGGWGGGGDDGDLAAVAGEAAEDVLLDAKVVGDNLRGFCKRGERRVECSARAAGSGEEGARAPAGGEAAEEGQRRGEAAGGRSFRTLNGPPGIFSANSHSVSVGDLRGHGRRRRGARGREARRRRETRTHFRTVRSCRGRRSASESGGELSAAGFFSARGAGPGGGPRGALPLILLLRADDGDHVEAVELPPLGLGEEVGVRDGGVRADAADHGALLAELEGEGAGVDVGCGEGGGGRGGWGR